jgi:hypothetical protein
MNKTKQKLSMGLLILANCIVPLNLLKAQEPNNSALHQTLKTKDSLLFEVGFNTCDLKPFEVLVSEKFEFYHDQSGITPNKTAFLESISNGLCKLPYRPRRELVQGSLVVYPLYKNGVLYGAIQMGKHRFFAIEKDKPMYFTSIAKFTHVWLLENGEWKLANVLSYEHQTKDEK